MLPPIPHSLAPVTAQQDVVRPRPEIPPVTPAEGAAGEAAISLDKRHPQEAAEVLREEQRRRQRRRLPPLVEASPEAVAEVLDAELEDLPRQGLWVDVEV